MKYPQKWTDEMIEILTKAYNNYPPDLDALALQLKTSKPSVKAMAARQGLTRNKRLSKEEMEFIKVNYDGKSITKLSKKMKRSFHIIDNALKQLNIPTSNPGIWIPNQQEIDYMKAAVGRSVQEIGRHLGKSTPTIRKHMRALGLKCPSSKDRYIKDPNIKKVRVRYERPKEIVKVIPVVPRNESQEAGENRIKEAMKRLGYA